jgi:thioesterase domain-containing protein
LAVLELESALRIRGFRAWIDAAKAPLPIRGTIFRAQRPRPPASPDLGWAGLFKALDIVDVLGSHDDLLSSPYASENSLRVCRAVSEATSPNVATIP